MDEDTSADDFRGRHQLRSGRAAVGTVLLGCMALYFVGYAVWQDHKLRRYRPVPAVVVSTDIKETRARRGALQWSPAIWFQYAIDGRTYTSDKVFVFKDRSIFRGWAESIRDQYRPGQSTTAYYNPADAADAVLIRRHSFTPYLLILGFMGPAIFSGSMALAFGMTPRRSARLATVLWHGTALLAGGHYFIVAAWPYETISVVSIIVYEWAGLVPLGLTLPKAGFAGRLRKALVLGPILSGIGGGLSFFVVGAIGIIVGWGVYSITVGAVVGAVASAVIGLVGGLLDLIREPVLLHLRD